MTPLPPDLAVVAAKAGLIGPPAADYTGKTFVAPAGVSNLRAAKFAWPGGHRLMEIGAKADVYVTESTLDCAGMTSLFAAAVQLTPDSKAKANFRRTRFDNAAMSFIKSFGASVALSECFLGAFGLNSPKDAHLEQIFVNQGSLSVSTSVLDGSAGAGKMAGGVTGLVYLEASSGPVSAVITNSLLRGAKAIKAPASIQINSRPHPVVLVIGGTGIEKGTSQYIAVTEEGGPSQIIDLGGNFDADTGAPIDLTWPKRP